MGEKHFVSGEIIMPDGSKLMDITGMEPITELSECLEDDKPIEMNFRSEGYSGSFTMVTPCTKRGIIRFYRMFFGSLIPKELGRRRQIRKIKRMRKCSF